MERVASCCSHSRANYVRDAAGAHTSSGTQQRAGLRTCNPQRVSRLRGAVPGELLRSENPAIRSAAASRVSSSVLAPHHGSGVRLLAF